MSITTNEPSTSQQPIVAQDEHSLKQILNQPSSQSSLSLSSLFLSLTPLNAVIAPNDDEALKKKEVAIIQLAQLYKDQKYLLYSAPSRIVTVA
jgi:hypothetical protein